MRVIVLALCTALAAAEGYPPSGGKPMLGVNMSPVPLSEQRRQNLTPDEGVYIRRVYDNTTASRIGIKEGDVVMSINGQPIGSMSDVRDTIFATNVGEDVQVTVKRGGQEVPLGGPLGTWPEGIPYHDINASAEERFREMQKRRLASEAEQAEERLRRAQEGQALTPSAGHFAGPDSAWTGGRTHSRELGRRASVLPTIRIPAMAKLLPAWELQVDVHVADPPKPDETIEVPVNPLLHGFVPRMGVDYAFSVHSEAL